MVQVKGRLHDPFFDRIAQTMKQIEISVQERGRMLLFICFLMYY